MTTSDVLPPPSQRHFEPPPSRPRMRPSEVAGASPLSAYLVPIGRLFFVLIFLESVPLHFTADGIAYAAQAGTPLAQILVPLSGVLALLGGLSVLLGYHARIGAALLALFLLPVTFLMHAFWKAPDFGTAQLQMVMFMKNVSMLGAALLLTYFGAGPLSLDARRAGLRRTEAGARGSRG